MILLVLFAAGFVVRAAAGALFLGPAYPDSLYYVNVARELATGHGFSVSYIWNFVEVGGQLPAHATLPIAADAHWMPLAELVQVPFIWLLGPTALASMLPFWIVGALAAPLTYVIARDAGLPRWAGFAGGLMVAVPAALTPYFSQPDNFGLYITLGAASLWLCARGLRGERMSFVVGGAVVGLATLARSDGVLLGLPYALVGARELWQSRRGLGVGLGWRAVVGCPLAFGVLVGPWLVRQFVVFGSLLPSADSGILWLRDYAQLFSVSVKPTFDAWLAQGIGPILGSRLSGLAAALGLFALLALVVALVPFALIGAWQRRHERAFGPFLVYATALFAASGLLFAVHVPYGTFIHSASALLPHTFLLVIVGIGGAVDWVARRRRSWDAARATRVFAAGAVGAVFLGALTGTITTVNQWRSVSSAQQAVIGPLEAADDSERVMAADPGAVRYLSGHGGIVTPNDNLAVIEQAMRDYDVRWLLLERKQIVPALAPILTGEQHPPWLSPAVAITYGTEGPGASATGGNTPIPSAALYAVCFSSADTRCSQ